MDATGATPSSEHNESRSPTREPEAETNPRDRSSGTGRSELIHPEQELGSAVPGDLAGDWFEADPSAELVVATDEPGEPANGGLGVDPGDRLEDVARVDAVCPYLVAAAGPWRAARPSRDHRCGAVAPMASPSASKQRRLCLTERHVECATYDAARTMRGLVVGGGPARPAWPVGRRQVVQTMPLVIDAGRPPVVAGLRDRPRLGQAALVGVLLIAIVALGYGRLLGPGATPATSSTSPGSPAPASVTGSATGVTPTPSHPATPVPSATARPTAHASPTAPAATPKSSGGSTYTVRPGDTLSGIAARYGTTVAILEQLNHITNPAVIHPGDVIIVP